MSYYNKAGIYIYFFPNGKTYVGQSIQLGKRLQRYKQEVKNGDKRPVICAIRKYGWKNIRIEYPFSIDRNSVNEIDLAIILDALEMRYIKEYESTYPKGYNMTNGADGTLFTPVLTENVVNRLYNSDNSKPILLYDSNGRFISEHKSIADCAYNLHLSEDEVRKYANCRRCMRGLYMVKFKKGDIVPNMIIPYSVKQKEVVKTINRTVVNEQVVVRKRTVNVIKTAVLQYSLDGKFIKEYESISEASRQFGKRINPFTHNGKSAGYRWKIKDKHETYADLDPINTPKLDRKYYDSKYFGIVSQYDLNGVKIAEYKSINEASIQTGIKYGSIYGIIQGTIKKPDYIWKCVE